ncbi:hypothetical protein [Metamycoplasma hyosynoviae]|uniref:hypothetical protein n=1 Tax=Metamycoplasma hyosynoviae TaxID=29559 RepID=UPI00235F32E7|nr:hypothetical protein [Metamycoplasma hyosynoviae]MDD1359562.1 hypothetical protein [Metamycoplasma hyosynoviae]
MKKQNLLLFSLVPVVVSPIAVMSCSKEITAVITKLEKKDIDFFTLKIKNNFLNLIDKSNNETWLNENILKFSKPLFSDASIDEIPTNLNISDEQYTNLKINFLNFFYPFESQTISEKKSANEFIKSKGIANIARKSSLIAINSLEEYNTLTKPFWDSHALFDVIKKEFDATYNKEYFAKKSLILLSSIPDLTMDFGTEQTETISFKIKNIEKESKNKVKLNINVYHYLKNKNLGVSTIPKSESNNYIIEINKSDISNITMVEVNATINELNFIE